MCAVLLAHYVRFYYEQTKNNVLICMYSHMIYPK